ncbi:TPA: hypothetical protein ACJ2WV_000430 [Kluyvera georgiana]
MGVLGVMQAAQFYQTQRVMGGRVATAVKAIQLGEVAVMVTTPAGAAQEQARHMAAAVAVRER